MKFVAKPHRQYRGFTIVELLVVIVVISILAAIGVSAYNGVQKRAVSSLVSTAANGWIKQLEAQIIQGTVFVNGNTCLGNSASDFPATADFVAGECLKITAPDSSPMGSVSYDATKLGFMSSISSKPTTVFPMVEGVGQWGDNYKQRGFWLYADSSPRAIVLRWFPGTPGNCKPGGADGNDTGRCAWVRSYYKCYNNKSNIEQKIEKTRMDNVRTQ